MINQEKFREWVADKTCELSMSLDGRLEEIIAKTAIAVTRKAFIETGCVKDCEDTNKLCDLILNGMIDGFNTINELAEKMSKEKSNLVTLN